MYRILTAIVLIPLVVSGVVWLKPTDIYGVTVALVALSAWEWTAVIPLAKRRLKWLYVALLVGVYCLIFWLPLFFVLLAAGLFWVFALLIILLYPHRHPKWIEKPWVRSLVGVMTVLPCWYSVNVLLSFEHGRFLLLYFLVLVWLADIGAYFVGKRFGRRKLAPHVSPNKSIEGAAGGAIACILIAVIVTYYFQLPFALSIVFVALSALVALVSIVGDLFVSVQKRLSSIKDMGNLLPGHGGLVDRVDSMMAAAPVFTLLMVVISMVKVWA